MGRVRGGLASAIRKRSTGREPYGIVPISLFQNEVSGGGSGASLPSENSRHQQPSPPPRMGEAGL